MASVLAVFDVRGASDELVARYDRAIGRIVEVSPGRPLAHVCVPTGTGMMVVDVWESPEALRAFAENPRFREALRESGLPEPEVRVYPVHALGWPPG